MILFKSDFYLKQNFAHLLISVNFVIFSVLTLFPIKTFLKCYSLKRNFKPINNVIKYEIRVSINKVLFY